MSALLLANPFGIAVAGIVAAGVAVSFFADEMVEAEEASLRATEAGVKFALTDFGKVGADVQRVQENLARVQKQIAIDVAAGNDVNESAIRLADRYGAQLEALTGQQQALASGTASSLEEAKEQQKAFEATANSVDASVAAIQRENGLLQENARERGVQIALLREVERIERKRGEGSVTDVDRQRIEDIVRENAELGRRAEVLERIQGPQAEFEADLAALNGLLAAGTITQEQFNAELLALTSNLDGVDLSALSAGGGEFDTSALDGLREQIALAKERALVEAEAQRVEAERSAVLADIQGPLAGLVERQGILNQLLAEGAITQGQYNEASFQNEETIRRLNPEYLRQAELLEMIKGPQIELAASQEALNVLLAEGSITAQEYAAALENIGAASVNLNTANAGLAAGFERGLAGMTDVRGAAEDLAVNGFGAAEDALVGFVRTGEIDFKKFVDSLLDDIARLLVRQAILGLFGGGAGAAAGGALGGAFAEGGDFTGGAPILVGEEGPEIITPKGSGEVIPAGETAARMAGAQKQNINVSPPEVNVPITNMIVGDIGSDLDTPEGEEGVLNVIRRNPEAVRRA